MPVLDEEGAVAGHAREQGLGRIDLVDVVEAGDQQAPLHLGHQLALGVRARRQHQIERHRAVGVGGGERVAGALDAGSAGGGAVPGHLLEGAFADQGEGRLGGALEVDRYVGAPGVGGVVAQGDPAGVGALAEASREGALALQVLQAVEGAVGQEPQHLGDRLLLEHHGVPARRNVPRRLQGCFCQGAQRGGFGVHLGPVAVAAGGEAACRTDRGWA